MIDFKNPDFFKLKQVPNSDFSSNLSPMLIPDEEIISSFRGVRDRVIFTNKRIISVNIQGLTGTKKDFTSLPYSKIQVFSVESAGVFDLDSELELWFSGIGKIKFEFVGRADIAAICQHISTFVLK